MTTFMISPEMAEANARNYLLSLASNQKPDIRPDFGYLNDLIKVFDDSFEDVAKEGGMKETPGEHITRLARSLSKHNKFQVLQTLLAETSIFPAALVIDCDEDKCPKLLHDAQLDPAMQEQAKYACQWLEGYKRYSQQVSPEGYADFHEDCGLCLLAGISGRRVKIPIGPGEYTSLYVALVAKPGTYAKTTTAKVMLRVLRAAGLGWFLGSNGTTASRLRTDMAGGGVPLKYFEWSEEKQLRARKREAMAAQVFWYTPEFGHMVQSMNQPGSPLTDLKKLLLEMDDYEDETSTSTQVRGREELIKPFLSFLGVMTPTSIRQNAKTHSSEWGDGFWSRFVFSCAPDDEGLDSPFGPTIPVPPVLWGPLVDWHEALGMPNCTIDPKKEDKKDEGRITGMDIVVGDLPETEIDYTPIQKYWEQYRSALKKMSRKLPEDLSGSYTRLPTRALRVAALFASFGGYTQIQPCHWAKAQEIAERWRRNLHRFYAQVNAGKDEESEIIETVRRVLQKNPREALTPNKIRTSTTALRKYPVEKTEKILDFMRRNGEIVQTIEAGAHRYRLM